LKRYDKPAVIPADVKTLQVSVEELEPSFDIAETNPRGLVLYFCAGHVIPVADFEIKGFFADAQLDIDGRLIDEADTVFECILYKGDQEHRFDLQKATR
jgi:hypothetical protein